MKFRQNREKKDLLTYLNYLKDQNKLNDNYLLKSKIVL